jgi:hypothetical protein
VIGTERLLLHLACTIQCPGSKVKSSDWLSAVALLLDKVNCYGVVTVHGDGGSVDISDGAHIASPVDELIASIWTSHQVEQRSFSISKSPLSRGGYRATSGAGGGEVVLNLRSNWRCPSARVKIGGD